VPETDITLATRAGASDDAIRAGMQYAVERLDRHGLPKPSGEAGQWAIQLATEALSSQVVPVRAAEQFIENVIVASTVREMNSEPPLTKADVGLYRDVSTWFFNSFWHE
jgi:hypothetical protein